MQSLSNDENCIQGYLTVKSVFMTLSIFLKLGSCVGMSSLECPFDITFLKIDNIIETRLYEQYI